MNFSLSPTAAPSRRCGPTSSRLLRSQRNVFLPLPSTRVRRSHEEAARCRADEDIVPPLHDPPPKTSKSYYTLYSSGNGVGGGSAASASPPSSFLSSFTSSAPSTGRPLTVDEIRAEFPALEHSDDGDASWVLLENAGGSQVPACVANAVRDHMLWSYAQLGAGYPHSDRATVSYANPTFYSPPALSSTSRGDERDTRTVFYTSKKKEILRFFG